MQERLVYLGQWLAANGEAVYGTRTFRDGAQWSAGRRQALDTSTNYRAKYDVETLTLHPAPGDARKEILFTRRGATLYAILPLRPSRTLVVRDLKLAQPASVTLLGKVGSKLAWRQRGADVSIELPEIADGELAFVGPLVVKIDGVVAN
jgi:alpha-L-fucosidase